MNNALAKQLKDAGFPQHNKTGDVYIPTLYDLIIACEKQFWSLRRAPNNKWIATGRLVTKKDEIPYYESNPYDEPDVAVAELFLSIKLHERQ